MCDFLYWKHYHVKVRNIEPQRRPLKPTRQWPPLAGGSPEEASEQRHALLWPCVSLLAYLPTAYSKPLSHADVCWADRPWCSGSTDALIHFINRTLLITFLRYWALGCTLVNNQVLMDWAEDSSSSDQPQTPSSTETYTALSVFSMLRSGTFHLRKVVSL